MITDIKTCEAQKREAFENSKIKRDLIEKRIEGSRLIIRDDDTHDMASTEMAYFYEKASPFISNNFFDLIYGAYLLGFDSGRMYEREV